MMLLFIYLISLLVHAERLRYVNPEFSIAWTNLTIGGLFPTTFSNGSVDVNGIDELLASICTLDCFNTGHGPFLFSGQLNLINYDPTERLNASEAAVFQLLKYNLVPEGGVNTAAPISPDPSVRIGAIVASLNINQYLAAYPVYHDFLFPVAGVDYLGFGIPYDEYPTSLFFKFKPRNVPAPFVISTAASYAMASAVVQLLTYMNWTLSTVLYGPDVFGMEGQAYLPVMLQQYNLLTACDAILTQDDLSTIVDGVASCLKARSSRVVIYWSGLAGQNITLSLQQQLGNSLIFILPGKWALTGELSPTNTHQIFSNFPSSFILDFLDFPLPTGCFQECLKDKAYRQLPPSLLNQYWQHKFNCQYSDDCPSTKDVILGSYQRVSSL